VLLLHTRIHAEQVHISSHELNWNGSVILFQSILIDSIRIQTRPVCIGQQKLSL